MGMKDWKFNESLQNRIFMFCKTSFCSTLQLLKIRIYFSREAIDQKTEESCRGAQILDTISSWENTFNTAIGENGVPLSGGNANELLLLAHCIIKQT